MFCPPRGAKSSWVIYSRTTALQHIYKGPVLFRKRGTAPNFPDDNTTATFSNSVDDLITDPQKESGNDWFCSNKMVINPNKFQFIVINSLGRLKSSY